LNIVQQKWVLNERQTPLFVVRPLNPDSYLG